MAAQLSSAQLAGKIEVFLDPDRTLSNNAIAACRTGLTHPSADPVRNMDFAGAVGDIILKYCLAIIYRRQFPDVRSSQRLVQAVSAAADNAVLAHIYGNMLKLSSEDIAVGQDYMHADKARSVHRRGTAVEAIIAAVMEHLGIEACVRFVGNMWAVLFSENEVDLSSFTRYDPISRVQIRVARHMDGEPRDWLHVDVTGPTADGIFSGRGGLKNGPAHLLKGPVYGRKKSEAKRALFLELDSDPGVTAFIAQHVKQAKQRRTAAPSPGPEDEEAAAAAASAPPTGGDD